IDQHATVNALGDIAVEATAKTNLVMIGIGAGGGFVGVGATVGVLSIDNHTHAYIGDFATVYAHGDVFVSAADDTHGFELSGAVGITLINVETDAFIHGNALINTLHHGDAHSNQSVYLNAGDNVNVQTFIIGVAVGAFSTAGAVDVGTLNSNVEAQVETGAQVNALQDIKVNALSLKDITGFDASGAAGAVGVGGAVSVWSIGTPIVKKTQKDDNTTD